MNNTKRVIIKGNIDYSIINDFIDFYSSCESYENGVVDKRNGEYFENIKVTIIPIEVQGKPIAEVDSKILSYLILFLDDFKKINIEFEFQNSYLDDLLRSGYDETLYDNSKVLSNRAFSLSYQIAFLNQITFKTNRVKLKADYYVKEGHKRKPVPINLKTSQYFIPPIFIEKNNSPTKVYFETITEDNDLYAVHQNYLNKVNEIISKKGTLSNNDFLSGLYLEDVSFIELTIFLLLINEKTFLSLKTTNVDITREDNEKKIRKYLTYSKEIALGLKELATNIEEHSTFKKGVITARVFDKKRLLLLKNPKGLENKYLNHRNEKEYINHKGNEFYLDVNIIDFGKDSVREKYILNLTDNKNKLGLKETEIDEDINNIRENFTYKDFFIIGKNYFKQNHQQNKLISRYGLHHFTLIVKDSLNGFIKVSTVDISKNGDIKKESIAFCDNFLNEDINESNYSKRGTTYNCIIPIKIDFSNESSSENLLKSDIKSNQNINTFKLLNQYEFKNPKDTFNPKKITIYNFNKKHIQDFHIDLKYKSIFSVYNSITNFEHKNGIIAINANKLKIKEESNWVRLLSALNAIHKDIIVYNIDFHITLKIKKLREKYDTINDIDFWSKDGRVLFYSKKSIKKYTRFGATILAGISIKQYNYLNNSIWKNHYSYGEKDGFFEIDVTKLEKPNNSIYGNKLFNNNKVLNFFELLITNIKKNSNLTLFEESVQYSLNTEFENRKTKDTFNKGYKISGTHFRLGSKIHIVDFYYAKKLFQNSFFTTPLAYILSNEIKKQLKNINELTLVGYENYSSFLISTVRNFLKHSTESITINHCIIDKKGNVSRESKKINGNIIIIVPIASSFSTSIKIKNQLNGIYQRHHSERNKVFDLNFIEPFYNLVLVGNKTKKECFDEVSNQDGAVDKFYPISSKTLKHHNWTSINPFTKIIKIKTFEKGNNEIKQKYFIPLYTEWQNAEECNLCYTELDVNKKIYDEVCLIETGNASITPKLIFGMPRTKEQNKYCKYSLDLTKSLLYGNLKKGNNSYLYFNRTGKVLSNIINRNNIIEWLKETVANNINIENDKIVLVTPATGSKSNFIDLVNEHVFNYTANTLIISLEEDYIENAESLYSDGLYNASTIIYVDDVLSTVNSFLDTNYIVKYIRDKKNKGKGIDYCISLINRMSYANEENVVLKLVDLSTGNISKNLKDAENKLFYFAKLNNPSIEEPNNIFPLEIERERYNKLSFTSSLDAIRKHFKDKELDLRPEYLSKKINERIKDYSEDIKYKIRKKDKKLYQLLVLNSIYKLFEYKETEKKETYLEDRNKKLNNYFSTDLKSFINLKKFIKKDLSYDKYHQGIIKIYDTNLDFTILKIICSTPLIYYKPIRLAAFDWIIKLLEEIRTVDLDEVFNEIESITTTLKEEPYKRNEIVKSKLFEFFGSSDSKLFTTYQNLKFLLKRSVQLKSNYIIHSNFLVFLDSFIDKLYDYSEKLQELESLFNKTDKVDLFSQLTVSFPESKHFIYDIVSYIQELVYSHETKSFQLEKNINSLIISKDGKCDKNTFANNTKNGNSYHFLRLLKLENTEAIERFWQYFKEKSKQVLKNNNSNFINFKNSISLFSEDPKYCNVYENLILNQKKTFNNYLKFKTILYNFENGKESANFIESDLNKLIKMLSSILIDNDSELIDAYVTINYNNKLRNIIKPEDLYVHNTYSNTFNAIGKNDDEISKSLTYDFFIGKSAEKKCYEHTLSNLEIIKEKSGNILIRENLYPIKDNSSNYLKNNKTECSFFEIHKELKQNEYNILLVSISDFKKMKNEKEVLYTQSVFTFILKKGVRIKEEKLRLILSLRNQLSNYFKKQTKNNTFLELLAKKDTIIYQKNLKHGIGNFISYQSEIIQDYEDIEDKIEISDKTDNTRLALDKEYIKKASFNFKEFNIINNSISSQISVSTSINKGRSVFFYDLFIDMIETIFKSEKLHYKDIKLLNYKEEIHFENLKPFNDILLPRVIINSILPEIILNQKKYGEKRKINWLENDSELIFEISNLINKYGYIKSNGFGLNMCNDIKKLYKNQISIDFPRIENSIFKVIIKIKKNDYKH